MNGHLLPLDRSLAYVRAGRGRFTLVGRERRYTYSLGVPKEWPEPSFVRVQVGPGEATYLGFVRNGVLYAGVKGKPDHPAFLALAWYLDRATANPEVAAQAEFWSVGPCGECEICAGCAGRATC